MRRAAAVIGLGLGLAVAAGGCGDDGAKIPLPEVVNHGGEVLAHLNLVTVTFPDDPLGDDAVAFGAVAARSRWIEAVGGEYGVHAGAQLASWRSPTPAPASMMLDDVTALIEQLVASSAVPGPTHDGVPVLYAVYLPATTQLFFKDDPRPMCQWALAIHVWSNGKPIAIIPDCYQSLPGRTIGASHEMIEAATDPFGQGYYADPPADDPWSLVQPEVGDLCNESVALPEGGFYFTRSWSNAEAGAWMPDPCVPAPPGDVYRIVLAAPATIVSAAAGATVTFDLTGWASSASAPWPIYLRHGWGGASRAANDAMAWTAQLSAPTIGVGEHVTLTLTVPATLKSGDAAMVNVWSGEAPTPIGIKVP